MPSYKFLTERALFIPKEKALVIADLHLGIEYGLRKSGITIPSQTENLRARLEKLIRQTAAKKLIILGDIKDEFRGLSWQEMREAPNFFSELAKKVELHLVKGNHDGLIENILPKSKRIKIYEPVGFRLGNFAFTHGHAWISKEMIKAKILLMGNLHPAVEFYSGRSRLVEHIWLRAPLNKKVFEKKFAEKTNLETAIILPAFNLLSGGASVNRKGFEIYKPFKKAFAWKAAEIFLLDGICLGMLKSLKTKSKTTY
ncbi:MAG TPA: metallophosphoesterase [archaeon]|nr:metallophosphoesterase [archaeon]